MKAFFSADVGLASLIIVVLLVLLTGSFYSSSSAISHNAASAKKQLNLLMQADFLLKQCSTEGGNAECDSKFLRSHEVIDNGKAVFLQPGEAQQGFCIKRIVLFQDRERIMAVCEK